MKHSSIKAAVFKEVKAAEGRQNIKLLKIVETC